MKIGILQTGTSPSAIREDAGDYNELFEDLLDGRGMEFISYRVLDGEMPASVAEADGWLITGSRHGVYEPHPWIDPLEAFVHKIIAAEKPLVGVCFGHQLIARALGGAVEKFDGGWAVGPSLYETKTGNELSLYAWHQDQVISCPRGARVLAHNDFCENAILAYDDRILTFQAHPEFTPIFMSKLLNERRSVLPLDVAETAIKNLEAGTQVDNLASAISTFFATREILV